MCTQGLHSQRIMGCGPICLIELELLCISPMVQKDAQSVPSSPPSLRLNLAVLCIPAVDSIAATVVWQ
jgi:hypothetical protein